jgi:N-acetylglucosaminyldiphosphoundecaprenol N-acetyl-beta-D-mannosaminyltransferase
MTITLPDWKARWITALRRLTLVDDELRLRTDLLATLASPQRPTILGFINSHAMNCLVTDESFGTALLQADHLLRDGTGMHILLRSMGMRPGLNLNGTDLIPRLVRAFDGRRIALYGTRPDAVSAAAERITQGLAPRSLVTEADGFQAEESYVQLALAQQPDLIVLGMGMPKQELVAQSLRAALKHPCLIVCGGAIIDFMGGKVRRAPRWVRAIGMEWCFRLLQEPARLGRRYVLGNPAFLVRTAKLLASSRGTRSGVA